MPKVNLQWILKERPVGRVHRDLFFLREAPIAPLKDGEVLVQNHLISIDPALRTVISEAPADKSYPNIALGDVAFGFGIGHVVESRASAFKPGDLVDGPFGWQMYPTFPQAYVRKRNAAYSLEDMLGVLSWTGMTAYYGINNILAAKAGETIVISAAAGAVGSIAGQIAKLRGCRVIGIAGGAKKCDWLVRKLGFDHAIDYKEGDLGGRLARVCGDGVDAYFDNVGGEILLTVILHMKKKGRIAVCGSLSTYNSETVNADLRRLTMTLMIRELQFLGLNVANFGGFDAAEAEMAGWLREGKLKAPVEVREGFESLPSALVALFNGENYGKLMVRVAQ